MVKVNINNKNYKLDLYGLQEFLKKQPKNSCLLNFLKKFQNKIMIMMNVQYVYNHLKMMINVE